MSRAWFVGKTKDQQELRAAQELRAQGFVVYLPKVYTRHQDGKRIEAQAALRFTGYIFICCQPGETSPINNTRGMDSSDGPALICSGFGEDRAALPLQRGIIETLRSIEDDELARAKARKKPLPRKDLMPGDQVQIFGDSNHAAFGRKGHLLGVERTIASVLEGMVVWKIPECDLKKIEQPDRKAA
ncbi:MAG TPA: hypothetical protein DEQ40_09170 [Oxalobacteraceae bacterium]|jgi:hypothetical protein|nr:hypothetical protein [Oxalobacteraceae bacterium]